MIRLGSYNLNEQEMILSHEGEDIVLEPKVCAVLVYLCENKNTYVSMNQLHENVWADRCVSDAAVRRTISKLRQLFGDDHKDPQYIQSIPRRGYKLICPVTIAKPEYSQTAQTHLQDKDIAQPVETAIEVNTKAESQNASGKIDRKTFLVAAFSALIIFVVVGVGLSFNADFSLSPTTSPIQASMIKSLPGNKRAVAQLNNCEALAFIGQMTEESGFQVYLKRHKKHDFELVTHDAHQPFALDFSSTGDSLFYSDLKIGSSLLVRIDLTNNGYVKTILLSDFYMITDVFTGPTPKFVYFSGQKLDDSPSFIYRHDLETQKTEQLTSSSQKLYQDLKGAISPDENLMAVLRYIEFEKRFEIRIIDLVNNEIIYRHQQDDKVFDMQWRDNEQLLMLDKSQLLSIRPKENRQNQLISNAHQLSAIAVIDKQTLLAIKSPPVKSIFIERNLPLNNWRTENIYTNNNNARYMSYHKGNKEKLVIYRSGKATTLAKMDGVSKELTPLIETMYSLKFQASATTKPLELIKINHRIALLNTLSSELTYITHGDDFIGDATFSQNEQTVLFSVKSYEKWEIHRYDINTAAISPILSGFRYIRPYKENYVVGTNSGELFWLDAKTRQQIPFNTKISNESNTHWDIKADNIYWSSFDGVKTHFHQLDISDMLRPKKYQKSFYFNKVRPQFSISKDSSSLLHEQRQQDNANIQKLIIKM